MGIFGRVNSSVSWQSPRRGFIQHRLQPAFATETTHQPHSHRQSLAAAIMTLLSAHRRPADAHLLRQLTASAREQHHPGGSMQSMSGRRSEWATRHGDLDSDSRPRYTTQAQGFGYGRLHVRHAGRRQANKAHAHGPSQPVCVVMQLITLYNMTSTRYAWPFRLGATGSGWMGRNVGMWSSVGPAPTLQRHGTHPGCPTVCARQIERDRELASLTSRRVIIAAPLSGPVQQLLLSRAQDSR
ncbi:hypothetical protein V8C26DRAFT_102712 [Trichoderma gracile]